MKVVTLIENLVYKQGLFAEHGLALYIETEKQKILFDTGQTGLFLQNAHSLGISIEDIDIYNSVDTHFKGMNTKINDDFIPDEFEDELFLVVKQHEKINIVTAYSHRGITNICATASQHFKLPVSLVLGGFHMNECSDEQYDQILRYFKLF